MGSFLGLFLCFVDVLPILFSNDSCISSGFSNIRFVSSFGRVRFFPEDSFLGTFIFVP